MQIRKRYWVWLGLLCLLAGGVLWRFGTQRSARNDSSATPPMADADSKQGASRRPLPPLLSSAPAVTNAAGAAVGQTAGTNAAPLPFKYRLSNTAKGIDELLRSEQSILLRNALIDSGVPASLDIPAHLRAAGDPGSYIVQARGPVTEAFRAALRQAGASIVAYVPQNAFLVRLSAAGAKQLAALPLTQTVLPWEPYFKLEPRLLALAVEQKPLPENARLNLLLFPGERDAMLEKLRQMNVDVLGEDRSPFGAQLVVRVPEDNLLALARLPAVQAIEPNHRRAPANDITRARVRVSTNTISPTTYLNLTGLGVLVNVNDTGVDAGHPDLAPRVGGVPGDFSTLQDYDGHGTHVAGIVASSGANGPDGSTVPGSIANANYRGMAPGANIFALPIDPIFGQSRPDSFLQETAAATNALISNNSWSYPGEEDYTFASANWDAAVRDALPKVTGPQPMVMVFAAGNSGFGDDDGTGGNPGSINSPATAKNVITVGAIENRRRITNEVTIGGGTNASFLGRTDSSNQVARFSSRGNVGPGIEGTGGRFKPDVVAPGTFIVSTRSSNWDSPENGQQYLVDLRPDQLLHKSETNFYTVFVPPGATELRIDVQTNVFTPVPPPPLLIYARAGAPPGPGNLVGVNNSATINNPAPDLWFIAIANGNTFDVAYDLRTVITIVNDVGNTYDVLADLDALLADNYRFESGTSMSAPVVSGMLALMQEFFASKGRTNSPALMKALLINGARSVSSSNPAYDYQVNSPINYQGWGLVNITNTIPAGLVSAQDASGPMLLFDQDVTNALATGQSQTRVITLTSNALNAPLRFTLVWTDPPGNPGVAVKLVNDLDLIVTNLTTGEVYVGNDISAGSLFNSVVDTNILATNAVLVTDVVNNVENIYLNRRLSSPTYSVTVSAKRVNVNAVTTHPDGIVQDYALVISSGNPGNASTLSAVPITTATDPSAHITVVSNGVPAFRQRVGANSPYLVSTNGNTNQWTFFVFENSGSTNTNVAFFTFLSPNLSLPRYRDADIDLYVSMESGLTNLDLAVINNPLTKKSVKRGGSEAVVFENAPAGPGVFYYAGVKSEDQQAANFSFFAIAQQNPFSSQDANGNVTITGLGVPWDILDGDPQNPGGVVVFAYNNQPIVIQNVWVTNTLTHESGGDLLGNLAHLENFVVLNNHRPFQGPETSVYEDLDQADLLVLPPLIKRTTDGPGSLRGFVGEEGVDAWTLTEVDNSQQFTGRVDFLSITMEPRLEDLTNGVGITRLLQPGRFFYTVVDVPADATNLSVCVQMDTGPLEVYLRRGAFPDRTNYDAFALIAPPGGCLNLGRFDSPPLSQGRYFIGIFNPNSVAEFVNIKVFIERDLNRGTALSYRSGSAFGFFDDAVTNSIIHVPRRQQIADATVGVRIDHDRVGDLVLHLVSPQGTRLLLAENRGGTNGGGYGFGQLVTNVEPSVASGNTPLPITNSFYAPPSGGTIIIDYEFYGIPDSLHIYYDGVLIYDTGFINGSGTFSADFGPSTTTNIFVVMNESMGNNGTAWDYQATIVGGILYAQFTDNTNFARLPIKFEPPPFTNINYSVTNVFTNGIVLMDGFDTASAAGNENIGVGTIFSGWRVDQATVDIVHRGYGMCTDPDSGINALDIDGFNPGAVSTNFVTVPSAEYVLSFAYTRNPNNPGCAPPDYCPRSATVDLSGAASFTITANPPNNCDVLLWQTTSIVFTATSPLTTLSLVSLSSPGSTGGVFFDTFKIEQLTKKISSGIYFQPEESLAPLRGEEAFGDWRLEIWDTRVGGALTNSALLAWRLNLTFINTNPVAIPLTNCITYSNEVSGADVAYFYINVPLSASYMTNFLEGSGNLNLIYNPNGVPTIAPGDTFLLTNTAAGVAVVYTNGVGVVNTNTGNVINLNTTPQIRPGRRAYLAVRNANGNETNRFKLTVCFDRTDPDFATIVTLSNGIGQCNFTIAPINNKLDYFAFDVATNAIAAKFEVYNLSGNADLVVKKGFPLPAPTFYFANSTNSGTTPEEVQIVDYSYRLLPGRWYMGVYDSDVVPVSYCVVASEVLGRVVNVTNGIGVTNEIVGTGGITYFKFNIFPNTYQADFIVTNATGKVTEFIRPVRAGPLLQPGVPPTNAYYSAMTTNGGGFSNWTAVITVSNTAPSNALSRGPWCVAVANSDTQTVAYTVLVIQHTNAIPDYLCLTSGITRMGPIRSTNRVDYYCFNVSSNAIEATFEVFGLTNNLDLYISTNYYPTPGLTTNFQYASTNLGTTNEFVCILTNELLTPGTYYIAVTNPVGGALFSYKIRATELLQSDIVRLTNAIPYLGAARAVTNSAINAGMDYYVYNVSSNAMQVTFETYAADGNVDLYARYGFPLTNLANFAYSSTNRNTNSEIICVTTNSLPFTLTNGDWYLAVVNRETNRVVNYKVRATEILTNEIIRLTNGIAFVNTNSGINIYSITGVQYYVFTVSTNAIQADFETFGANGNVDLYVRKGLPLCITNYHYQSTNLGWSDEAICVKTNSTPVVLTNGDWYLTVVNRQVTNVVYSVRATELTANDIVSLTNGVAYTNQFGDPLRTNSVRYYAFNVSSNAIQVNFETYGAPGNVDLYVRPRELPCGPAYAYASTNGGWTNELIRVATNSLPVRLTNGLWYLAVVNRETNAVTHNVRVTEILDRQIVRLTNAVAYSNEIASADNYPTNGVNYYVFRVSTNAIQAKFETFGTSNNVDLFVTRGLPLATPDAFDYASTNGGNTNEVIYVLRNSSPVVLTNGDWYLTVVNRDVGAVPYSVRATEVLAGELVRLTNCLAYSNSVTAGGTLTNNEVNYYVFNVASNAIQVDFETFNANGNVDLYVRKDLPLPGDSLFARQSINGGATNEFIAIQTNDMRTALTPGDWYLAVVNRETNATSYYVRVAEALASDILLLTNGVPHMSQFTPNVGVCTNDFQYYLFKVATNAVQVFIEAYGADGNVDLFVRQGLPLPTTNSFDYASTNGLLTNELIIVATNSATNSVLVPLAAGEWYIGAFNRDFPAQRTYTIRVTQVFSNEVIRLTNDLAYASALTPTNNTVTNGVSYYVFNVSSNALQVNFETLAANGDVDLFIRQSLPLPGETSFFNGTTNLTHFYNGTNGGRTNEIIVVATNSAPFALEPGDWFLAVVNRATSNLTYSVRVTQFGPVEVPKLFRSVSFCSATNDLLPALGTRYFSFTMPAGAAQASFKAYDPFLTNNVDLFLTRELPLPGPMNFLFASTNLGGTNEVIIVTTNSAPVLEGGDWFMAVVNRETNATSICVEADYTYGDSIIRLTNGVSYTLSATNLNTNVYYFVYEVSTNALQVNFDAFGPDGGLTNNLYDLFVRKALPLPDESSFDYAGTNGDVTAESITVGVGSTPVTLSPGDWFLTLVRRTTNAVFWSVRATEFGAGNGIVRLTNAVAYAVPPPNEWAKYLFVFGVSSNGVQVNFEALQTNGLLSAGNLFDLFVRRSFPANDHVHDYAGTNGGATNEFIPVGLSSPITLTPGDWYLFLRTYAGTNPVPFLVRATEYGVGTNGIVRLTNGVPYASDILKTNLPGSAPTDYYVFGVSTNAVRANFEVLSSQTPVALVARKGTPLPTLTGFDYKSDRASTNDELIVVFNSSVIPLTPGDWYLSVIGLTNQGSGAYSIKATEFDTAGTNIHLKMAMFTTNSLCFTWTNVLPGVNYFVQAKVSLNATSWVVLSLTMKPVTNELTWCVALPTAYSIFDLVEGIAPQPPTSSQPPQITQTFLMTNSFCFTWTNSAPGVNYFVQAKLSLNALSWSTMSPTLTASSGQMTWCVPLPTPYTIFRVVQGAAPSGPVELPMTVSPMPGGNQLQWNGPTNQQFKVQWSSAIVPSAWNYFTNTVTSTSGAFTFLDDGSQTGGLGGLRFYRLMLPP